METTQNATEKLGNMIGPELARGESLVILRKAIFWSLDGRSHIEVRVSEWMVTDHACHEII